MATAAFTLTGFSIRLVFGLILVFASYNPSGYSFYHWSSAIWPQVEPLPIFIGVVLAIGWTIFIRATFRSLGIIGLTLALAFFGSMLWLIIDWGILPKENRMVMEFALLTVVSAVLAVGMSWSHIRRRFSGQADVDDIEE